jgi:hypothetical protein
MMMMVVVFIAVPLLSWQGVPPRVTGAITRPLRPAGRPQPAVRLEKTAPMCYIVS